MCNDAPYCVNELKIYLMAISVCMKHELYRPPLEENLSDYDFYTVYCASTYNSDVSVHTSIT